MKTNLLLLALISFVATAKPVFEGRTVVTVDYEPEIQPVDPQDLAQLQPVRVGQPYRAEDVADAIDGLFATGRYRDIRVEAELVPGGVRVRFLTVQRQFVGGVHVEGKVKRPPNRGQILNTTNLILGTPFEQDDLEAAKNALRRAFESNGLYEARFDPILRDDPRANQVHFTFHIRPGNRARYGKPVFKGDVKLPEKTLLKATGWRYRIIGLYRKVTAQNTQSGLARLQKKYQSEDRLMARVETESLDYNPKTRRLHPTISIDAGPKVEVRSVEAKISKGDLRRHVPIYQEQRVDRDLLVEGARNLRDHFQARGYYDVDIDFRQREESADQVVIEYVVAQGQRYKVARVSLSGYSYFSESTLRERMFVQPADFPFRRGRYSGILQRRDEEIIENLYRSNGFRDVKVTSQVTRGLDGKPDRLAVDFTIQEGPQWFVDSIDIEGNSHFDEEYFIYRLDSAEGQPFSELSVASDRSRILTDYFDAGFPNATFEWTAEPAASPQRVKLTYKIDPGQRQFVRDVIVTGLDTTRWNLARKHIVPRPGDPLSTVDIFESQRNLYNLGIFARVNTAIQNPEGAGARKYVLYDIEEANRYTLGFGLGAELARFGGTTSTLSSPGGATGFSPRVSVDLSRLNFLGLGHVVSLRTRVSNLQQRASLNYVAPRIGDVEGRTATFTVLHDDSRDVRTFASRRQEAAAQISEQFTKSTTGLFRFTYRRVSTSDVVIPTLLVPALLQPVRIGMLSGNILQDRRDDPADPTRGVFNTLDTGLAWRGFASQRNFLRFLGRNATYHRISRNLVFARQTQLGLLLPFNNPAGLSESEAIPLPERFFGGGSTSHRGFPDNQAGPRDIGTPAGPGAPATQPTGFPLGGNALLFNNLELRFPLLGENIKGVLFHDAGNIFSRVGAISFRQKQRDLKDFDYMVHAVGFGVRYKTPVGPVRADLVYSINPPSYVGFRGTVQELLACNPNIPIEQLPSACRGVQQRVSRFQFFFSIGQTF